MNCTDKVAIVTGSSSGVGRELAVKLAALGAKVAVNYANSKSGAEETVNSITELGGKAFIFQADVSDEQQCKALVAATLEHYGQLDILVNNAGTTTFVEHKSLDLLSDDIWQNTLGTNLMGPFYMCRAALPAMIEQGGGEIVMTSSIAGLTSNGSSLAYCASKAGLNSLTKNLAKALGEHQIRVNAICPGLIDGQWGEAGWGESWDAVKEHVSGLSPLSTIATPADVADALLSVITGSDLITGQIITIDSGMTL